VCILAIQRSDVIACQSNKSAHYKKKNMSLEKFMSAFLSIFTLCFSISSDIIFAFYTFYACFHRISNNEGIDECIIRSIILDINMIFLK
jgi:hypothetical protein